MTMHDDQNDHDHGTRGSTEPRLCPEDCRVLDHLAEHGFDRACLEQLEGEDRERCERLLACLGLVDLAEDPDAVDASSEDAESLIDATLLRIDRAEREREAAMRLDSASATRTRSVRMPDFIAVAASLLLAIGVLWPVIQQVQNARQVARDSGNMTELYGGIQAYANANGGATPFQADILPNVFDWLGADYGRASGGLDVLVNDDYCEARHLHLPGGPAAESRYSVRVVAPSFRVRLFAADEVLVSNHNPIAGRRAGAASLPTSACDLNAECHGGRGQNMLRGDGSVDFHSQPDRPRGAGPIRDNVWLPDCPEGTVLCPVDRTRIETRDVFLTN